MRLARIHRRNPAGEQGYILLLMLLFVALVVIAMTAAAPYLTTQIKRDREIEMIHRGEQYARAVKRYYRKFGRYPSRIEDLEKTNNIRFLRKRYKDPMSKDGSWRLVRYGEVQFGGAQALTGATPVANMGTGLPSSGASSFGQSSFGSSNNNATNPKSSSTTGETPNSGTTAQSTSLFGQQVFGGGGAIIGVASLSKKNGLHEFNKKSAYKDWLFVYDPSKDKGQLIRGPYNPNAFVGQFNNSIGSPAGQVGQPAAGAPGGFANPGSGGGFGNSGAFGNSGGFGNPGGMGGAQVPPPPPPPR